MPKYLVIIADQTQYLMHETVLGLTFFFNQTCMISSLRNFCSSCISYQGMQAQPLVFSFYCDGNVLILVFFLKNMLLTWERGGGGAHGF